MELSEKLKAEAESIAAPWRGKSHSLEQVKSEFERLRQLGHAIVLLIFTPERELQFDHGECGKERVEALIQYLAEVVSVQKVAPGACLIDIADGFPFHWSATVPVLRFARHVDDKESLLIPDFDYIRSGAYSRDFQETLRIEKFLPWDVRMPIAFWRGSTTGPFINSEDWRENPRIRLSELSAKHAQEGWLDAYVTKIVQCDKPEIERQILQSGLVHPPTTFYDAMKYRYLIDIDGNSCAWSCFIRMASGSLLLKVKSSNEQWFYRFLEPGVHYLEIKEDFSNLKEAVEWARANDAQAKAIADAARAVYQELSYESSGHFTAAILNRVLPLALF